MSDAHPTSDLAARLAQLEAENERLRALVAAQARPCAVDASHHESLCAGDARYRGAIEQMTDGLLLTDETGALIEFNPAMEAITGLRRDQVLGMAVWDLQAQLLPAERRTPEALARIRAICQQVLTTGQASILDHPVEVAFARRDGTRRYVAQDAFVVRTPQGICFGGIARDITANVDAERRRARAEEFLRLQRDLGLTLSATADLPTALDHVLEVVCQVEGIDCGGVYLAAPGAGAGHARTGAFDLVAHRGLSPSFVQKTAHYPADSPNVQLMLAGQSIYGCYEQVAPSRGDTAMGQEGLRALAMLPILHEGQIVAALNLASHTQDEIAPSARVALEAIAAQIGGTLARLRAEDARRQSERNLQTLFDSLDDFLLILDAQGRILHTNPVVRARLGYSAEELAHLTVLDMHPPERRSEAAATVVAMLAGRDVFCPIPLITRDGALIPVETRVTRGRWDDQDVLFGISRDITARTDAEQRRARAEEALHDSEDRYRLLVDNATEAIYVVQEHTLRFANPMCARLLGIPQAELLGRRTLDFVPEQDRAWAGQHHERLLRGEVLSDQAQFRVLLPGGGERWLLVNAVRILWNGQAATLNLASDITAQKAAEEGLRQREAELHTLVETLPCGVFAKDLAGRFLRVNRLWAEMAGLPIEDIVGKTIYDLVPEMPDHWKAADARLLTTGESQLVEQQLPPQVAARTGIELVETRRVPLRDAQGAIVGLLGVTLDITARAQAERRGARAAEVLRQRDEELNALIENLPCGVFVKDRAGRYTRVNHAYEVMAGLRADEILGKTLYDLSPEMAAQWTAEDEALFATGELQVFEQRMPLSLRQHTATVVFETRKVPLRDAQGAVVGLVGVSVDLTERVRAEEALREALANVRTLRGLVPICASCKKIRDDSGYWHQVEVYVRDHSEAEFSHGICPDCMRKLYPDLAEDLVT